MINSEFEKAKNVVIIVECMSSVSCEKKEGDGCPGACDVVLETRDRRISHVLWPK